MKMVFPIIGKKTRIKRGRNMDKREAIEKIKNFPQWNLDDQWLDEEEMQELTDMVVKALEMQEKHEAQWIDDMNNPLEPWKLQSALQSEIFKLEYRKANKPKDINILDYTIIYALKDCLERYSEKRTNYNCKIGRAQTYTLVEIVGSKTFSGYLFCSDRSRT